MYRIELSPGEETAFRSIEELAVAIKRGFVTSRARIWHNASNKWLPIEFHPHYKIAASMQLTTADLVAGPPVEKLEVLSLGQQMDPPRPPVQKLELVTLGDRMDLAPRVRAAVQPEQRAKSTAEPEPKPRKKAAAKPAAKVAAKPRRPKSGRRPIRIALAGALLVAGAHLVFSGASASRTEDTAIRPRTHRHLITTPLNIAQQGRPETTAAAVLPRLPTGPRLPSLESRSDAATPPLGAFRAESDTGIQPAPASIDIAAPVPQSGDSLAKKMVDSSGKKTLKRILRTISGTPAAEQTRSKR
jgi:hypothetical protein